MGVNRQPEQLLELTQDLESLSEATRVLGQTVVGQRDVLDQLMTCLLAGGHALIEGAPGLGKTLLVKSIATVLGLEYSRIQFTPDLMPADITGTLSLFYEGGSPVTRFQSGPLFSQLVLADEINRATPKTQAALLEAMQERTVTVAGVEHRMKEPFFVLATQNPYEMDGTYALPEAQVDRFLFKVEVDNPSVETLMEILDLTTGPQTGTLAQVIAPGDLLRLQLRVREMPIATSTKLAIARFTRSTLPQDPSNREVVKAFVRFGISPRGAQSLVLAAKASALLKGRYNVGIDDVRSVLLPALRHRLQLNYQGITEGISVDRLLKELLETQLEAVGTST